MIKSKKIQLFLVVLLIIIISVIIGRHLVTKHFVKKFSKMPPPGVIVNSVSKSTFYESIETFGTALSLKNKNYRIKKSEILKENIIIGKVVEKGEVIFETSDEKIIAPFKGILGKREIAQGVLGSESLIITLDDLKKIIIDIKVPENYVSVLKSGLKAEVTSSAYKKIFKGKIGTISSRIDPSTRSILSRIIVDNSDFEIIPGQLMTVKIIYNETNQIGVPESAVTVQGNTAFVYVVNDDAAEKKNIKIGKRNFGKVSVISGLNEGDIVIAEGVSKVRDKVKVKIVTP